MSLAVLQLASRGQKCSSTMRLLTHVSQRQLHSTPAVFARREKKPVALSKKQLALKEQKRAKKSRKNIYDKEKMTLEDAINVLRAVEVTSPKTTFELVIKTAMGKGTTIPKGRFNLPRATKEGAKDRILVFADGRLAEEAKKAGADIVGGMELVEGIISGRHQATLFLCSHSFIRAITPRLGRVLGPRGLMPSERRGTVTDDLSGYIRRLKGTSEWRGDKDGTIRQPIAKMNFPVTDVVKNIRYFLQVVKEATGNVRSRKGNDEKNPKPVNEITRVLLSTTQGPGIQISDH